MAGVSAKSSLACLYPDHLCSTCFKVWCPAPFPSKDKPRGQARQGHGGWPERGVGWPGCPGRAVGGLQPADAARGGRLRSRAAGSPGRREAGLPERAVQRAGRPGAGGGAAPAPLPSGRAEAPAGAEAEVQERGGVRCPPHLHERAHARAAALLRRHGAEQAPRGQPEAARHRPPTMFGRTVEFWMNAFSALLAYDTITAGCSSLGDPAT